MEENNFTVFMKSFCPHPVRKRIAGFRLKRHLKSKAIESSRRLVIETSGICNLLCRMCPYVSKEKERKILMPTQMFEEVVHEASQAGFTKIELCPSTGEVFLDKDAFKKLQILENSSVEKYSVVSNFISIPKDGIEYLCNLVKLESFKISIYGCDLHSFESITQRSSQLFNRLLDNLDHLYNLLLQNPNATARFKIDLWPGVANSAGMHTKLMDIIKKLESHIKVSIITTAENRAGTISEKNVQGLGITVRTEGRTSERNGPCALLFRGSAILPNGDITACSCGDKSHKMIIGRIAEKPLDIHRTVKNEPFNRILSEQENNIFTGPCKVCSRYESVLDCFSRSEYIIFKKRIGVV